MRRSKSNDNGVKNYQSIHDCSWIKMESGADEREATSWRHKQTKFLKSFKYKHKRIEIRKKFISTESCDSAPRSAHKQHLAAEQVGSCWRTVDTKPPKERSISGAFITYALILLLCSNGLQQQNVWLVAAFCPSKCLCSDQMLSANCTNVPSISIVPMTFNPLLKQLTLNHLPMLSELSNSLSVYRQLESLNLNSNQLRQIKYENFNFKAAPNRVALLHSPHSYPSAQTNSPQELSSSNQLFAKQLKQAFDKSVHVDNEDEIRFHLRDLNLSDNKIEQLGSLEESDQETVPDFSWDAKWHLKSAELERQAPFLTLTKLERLNLSGNKLTSLHQHVFLGLLRLKQLDLSRNSLEHLDKHAFVGLVELELLSLRENKLARHLHQLHLAFCRAPMVALHYLDLSENYASERFSNPEENRDIVLPNQMFICTPQLVSLELSKLQLRYVQVNAFDNLKQLESLHLRQNFLEQVPVESLRYSNSNLSESLLKLDLSENPIEFVNANTFSSLRSLERLWLNSMPRLVSFDLASLSFRQKLDSRVGTNVEQLARNEDNFKNALRALLPEHLFSRIEQATPGVEVASLAVNQSGTWQLINERLAELSLNNNPLLQSIHSSLAARAEFPRGKVRMNKLRQLDLRGAVELRELQLENMIDFRADESPDLNVDLSFANQLNCSSCQMRWLVDAVRELKFVLPRGSFGKNTSNNRIHLVGSPETVSCAQPANQPLVQLVDLETSFSPIFEFCNAQQTIGPTKQVATTRIEQPQQRDEDARLLWPQSDISKHQVGVSEPEAQEEPSKWLAASALAVVLLALCLTAKLLVGALRERRRFKWRSPSLVGGSLSSPSASASSSSGANCPANADCSSGSTVAAGESFSARPAHSRLAFQQQQALRLQWRDQLIFGGRGGRGSSKQHVGQIERAQRRGNLFSRIAERWSGAGRSNLAAAWRSPPAFNVHEQSSESPSGRFLHHIIENRLVYGGDKILNTACATQRRATGDGSAVNQQGGADERQQRATIDAGAKFIKPTGASLSSIMGCQAAGSSPRSSSSFVYANCQQQDAAPGETRFLMGATKSTRCTTQEQEQQQQQRCALLAEQLRAIERDPSRAQATCRPLEWVHKLAPGEELVAGANSVKQRHLRHSSGVSSDGGSSGGQTKPAGSFVNSSLLQQDFGGGRSTGAQLAESLDVNYNGHIYVTLDRPIRQQRGPNFEVENGIYDYVLSNKDLNNGSKQHWSPNDGQSFSSQATQATNCMGAPYDYKSFEWSPLSNSATTAETGASGSISSSSASSYLKRPLKSTEEDQEPKGAKSEREKAAQLDKLSAEFVGALSSPIDEETSACSSIEILDAKHSDLRPQGELRESKSAARTKRRQRAEGTKMYDKNGSSDFGAKGSRKFESKRAAVRQQAAEFEAGCLGEGKTSSNVTGHLNYGTSSDELCAYAAEAKSGGGGGTQKQQQLRAEEQHSAAAASLLLTNEPETRGDAGRQLNGRKYDANHDVAMADEANVLSPFRVRVGPIPLRTAAEPDTATTFCGLRNDYVINGLRPVGVALETMRRGGSQPLGADGTGAAEPSVQTLSEQRAGSYLRRQQQQQQSSDVIGQQEHGANCDFVSARSDAIRQTAHESARTNSDAGLRSTTVGVAQRAQTALIEPRHQLDKPTNYCDFGPTKEDTRDGSVISVGQRKMDFSQTMTRPGKKAQPPAGSAANQNEIYSNQFYYCRPALTAHCNEAGADSETGRQPML